MSKRMGSEYYNRLNTTLEIDERQRKKYIKTKTVHCYWCHEEIKS